MIPSVGGGNSVQGGASGPATTGALTSTTSTGSKAFNFNAPASRLTDSTFGKGLAVAAVLVVLVLGAAWIKKKR